MKFSHNTSPCGTKTFVWDHVNHRNDLDLVIRNARAVDDYGSYQDRILMKITGGAEVLETQDLSQLVLLCRDFDPATGTDYPVDVVVKSPFMAMRYPKTINTVRRIQVKFRTDLDFKRTLDTMKDLGLPITYRDGSAPAAAPSTSTVQSLPSLAAVLSGASQVLSDTLRRPVSSTSMSSSTLRGSSPLKQELASSPIKSDFKVPSRSDTAFSDQGPDTRIPYSNSYIPKPFSNSPLGPNAMPFSPRSRVESSNPPPSQSFYVSQIEREFQNRRMSQPVLPYLNPKSDYTNYRGAASLYISQMQSERDEHSERVESTSRLSSASPFFSSERDKDVRSAEISRIIDTQRPSSTPIDHSGISKMWIPPKRELPFPKPRKASLPKSTPTPDPRPILPKVTHDTTTESLTKDLEATADAASTPVKKPAPKKRVAQRKATNTKTTDQQGISGEGSANVMTEESIPKLASIQEEPEELSPLAAKSAAASLRPASAPGLISKAILPPKKRAAPAARPASPTKRPKMVDAATQTQRLSGVDQMAVQRASSSSNPPDLKADNLPPESAPESYMNELEAFITKHNPQPKPKEVWQTPGYAEADEACRHAMLNNFICENLDNPDFLQLCQDTEFAWRRIGLGM